MGIVSLQVFTERLFIQSSKKLLQKERRCAIIPLKYPKAAIGLPFVGLHFRERGVVGAAYVQETGFLPGAAA